MKLVFKIFSFNSEKLFVYCIYLPRRVRSLPTQIGMMDAIVRCYTSSAKLYNQGIIPFDKQD